MLPYAEDFQKLRENYDSAPLSLSTKLNLDAVSDLNSILPEDLGTFFGVMIYTAAINNGIKSHSSVLDYLAQMMACNLRSDEFFYTLKKSETQEWNPQKGLEMMPILDIKFGTYGNADKFELFRHEGDYTLMSAGIFKGSHMKHRDYNWLKYHGQQAYSHAASISQNANLFQNLAHSFDHNAFMLWCARQLIEKS